MKAWIAVLLAAWKNFDVRRCKRRRPRSKWAIYQLRSELQDMEAQQISEAQSTREQLQDLQDQIARQKVSKQELETELDWMKQEFHYVEDLHRRTPCKAELRSRGRNSKTKEPAYH